MKRYRQKKMKMLPSPDGLWVLHKDAVEHLHSMEVRQEMRERSILRALILQTYWEDTYQKQVTETGSWPASLKGTPQESTMQLTKEAEYKYRMDCYFNRKVDQRYYNIRQIMDEKEAEYF